MIANATSPGDSTAALHRTELFSGKFDGTGGGTAPAPNSGGVPMATLQRAKSFNTAVPGVPQLTRGQSTMMKARMDASQISLEATEAALQQDPVAPERSGECVCCRRPVLLGVRGRRAVRVLNRQIMQFWCCEWDVAGLGEVRIAALVPFELYQLLVDNIDDSRSIGSASLAAQDDKRVWVTVASNITVRSLKQRIVEGVRDKDHGDASAADISAVS